MGHCVFDILFFYLNCELLFLRFWMLENIQTLPKAFAVWFSKSLMNEGHSLIMLWIKMCNKVNISGGTCMWPLLQQIQFLYGCILILVIILMTISLIVGMVSLCGPTRLFWSDYCLSKRVFPTSSLPAIWGHTCHYDDRGIPATLFLASGICCSLWSIMHLCYCLQTWG